MSFFQIYELRDPDALACRYVGRTKLVVTRYHQHLNAARRGERLPSCLWIRKLLDLGKRPVLNVIETCTSTDVDAREIFWIAERRRQGCRLLNITEGGGGLLNVSFSAETRNKISQRRMGMKFTEQHKANMSASRKGKRQSPAHRLATSLAMKGKIHRSDCERRAISERMKGNLNSVGNIQSLDQVEARAANNRGAKNGRAVLTEKQVHLMREMFASGKTRTEISTEMSVVYQLVSNVIAKRSYSTV